MKRLCRTAVICMLIGGLALPVSVHAKEANVPIEPRMTNIHAYGTELWRQM